MTKTFDKNSMEDPRTPTLDTRTKIRLGAVVPIIMGALAFFSLTWQIQSLKEQIRSTWTISDQLLWEERFKGMNPNVKIPEGREVIADMNRLNNH